jgi:hypothetical protein
VTATNEHPEWTSEQLAVIEAPVAARLLVDAGPGTGKTATLCARIARLIDCAGLDPGEIWIISFTRTAVAEIRGRVSTYLREPSHAHGIRVATIDSHAWSMNVGFNEHAVLSGSFDDNIVSGQSTASLRRAPVVDQRSAAVRRQGSRAS